MKSMAMKVLGKGSIASFVKTGVEIAWVLLWVAAGALALAVLAYIGILILIEAGVLSHEIIEPHPGAHQIGPILVETEPGDRLVWPVMAPVFLGAGVAVGGALVIVQRLRFLFASFTSGNPFSKDNSDHLRVIWIAMLVMELSRYLIAGVMNVALIVFGQPNPNELTVEAPINITTWGAILILIVLAEVFREGARLREEQELTI